MLGIADLHTPEAIAAAESAIAGYQPLIPLAASSSGTDSEDSSDNDSDDDNDDDDDDDDENDNDDGNDTCLPVKLERSKSGQGNSLSEDVNPSKKQQMIVELWAFMRTFSGKQSWILELLLWGVFVWNEYLENCQIIVMVATRIEALTREGKQWMN